MLRSVVGLIPGQVVQQALAQHTARHTTRPTGLVTSLGAVGRFARWGLAHGPWWGALAGAVVAAPATALLSLPAEGMLTSVLAGAALGLVGGPALGVLVGLTCLVADRAPKWILDAPDYVAVSTVVLVTGAVVWPMLAPSRDSLVIGLIAVLVLSLAPAVDAARNAETLLHPGERGPSPGQGRG